MLDILLILVILIMLITKTGEMHRAGTFDESGELPPHVEIDLYGVLLEDAGVEGEPIGCGDSLVVVREYESEQYRYLVGEDVFFTPEGALVEALRELISVDNEMIESTYEAGSYYTAAYQPQLTVEGVEKNGSVANVFLSGEVMLGGVCDAPRLKEQMDRTATQFDDVDFTRFYLNGSEEKWEKVFSGR